MPSERNTQPTATRMSRTAPGAVVAKRFLTLVNMAKLSGHRPGRAHTVRTDEKRAAALARPTLAATADSAGTWRDQRHARQAITMIRASITQPIRGRPSIGAGADVKWSAS